MSESQLLPIPSIPKRPIASALFGYIPRKPGPSNSNTPNEAHGNGGGGAQGRVATPLQDDKHTMSLRLLYMQAQASFETYSTKQDTLMTTLSENLKNLATMMQLFDGKDDELHAHITAVANRTQTEVIKSTKACHESVSGQLESVRLHHTEHMKDTQEQATTLTSINERLHALQSHLTQLQQTHHTHFSQLLQNQQTHLTDIRRSHDEHAKGLDTLKIQIMQENRTTVREVLSSEIEGLKKSLREDLSDMISGLTRDAIKTCGDKIARELNQQVAAAVSLTAHTRPIQASLTLSTPSRGILGKRLFPVKETALERTPKRSRCLTSSPQSQDIFESPSKANRLSANPLPLTEHDSPLGRPMLQCPRTVDNMALSAPHLHQAADDVISVSTFAASETYAPREESASAAKTGASALPQRAEAIASARSITSLVDRTSESSTGSIARLGDAAGGPHEADSSLDDVHVEKETEPFSDLSPTHDHLHPLFATAINEQSAAPQSTSGLSIRKRRRSMLSDLQNYQIDGTPAPDTPLRQNSGPSQHRPSSLRPASFGSLRNLPPQKLATASTLKDHFVVRKRGSAEARTVEHDTGRPTSARSLSGPGMLGSVKPTIVAKAGLNRRMIQLPSESQEEEEEEDSFFG